MKVNTFKMPYIIRLITFWLLYFAGFRILFVLYHHTRISELEHAETVKVFCHGLPLDVAVACVMVLLPFVLWVMQQFFKSRLIHRLNQIYNYGLIILISLLSITNIKMYGEWGGPLSIDILTNIFYPLQSQPMTFISTWSLLLLLAFSSIFAFVGIKYYRMYLVNFSSPVENKNIRLLQIIIVPVMLAVGYRVGLNVAGIKEDKVVYSQTEINNHIATNNIWYFTNSIVYRNNPEQ